MQTLQIHEDVEVVRQVWGKGEPEKLSSDGLPNAACGACNDDVQRVAGLPPVPPQPIAVENREAHPYHTPYHRRQPQRVHEDTCSQVSLACGQYTLLIVKLCVCV